MAALTVESMTLNIARGRLRALTLLAGEIAMVTLARPMPPICTALLRVVMVLGGSGSGVPLKITGMMGT